MVEAGGGLSLAIGMALCGPTREPRAVFVNARLQTAKAAQTPVVDAAIDAPDTSAFKVCGQPMSVRHDLVRIHGDLIRWL